ncbi:hypothetical protein PITCH_A1510024 [uncultured Desulfobacterium sp.]|uniref:histidine kinase n=1 Tax=uncultured Desulfobacterium sp. TaxID=201089 RepID=A0A445MTG4_9BACT|nr:hypothetical protein PITCH_A1510024 [uncultured Desulfobacterium sp.]
MNKKPTCEELEQRVAELEEQLSMRQFGEQSFSIIADNAFDGIVVVTADGFHVYANKRAAEILGYSVEEMRKVNIRQLARPDEIPIFEDRIKRRIRGEDFSHYYQTELVTKAGTTVPVEISCSHIIWRGQPADFTIIRDITGQKRSEEALSESEKKLRSFIDTTSDWVWELDLNGYFVYASPMCKNFLGYDPEEVVGTNMLDLLADEYAPTTKVFFKQMRENPRPFTGYIVRMNRKDGEQVVVEVRGTPVYDKDGSLAGYFGCDKDITEKYLGQKALRESEKKYRFLAENVSDVIWTLDMDLKTTYVSPSIQRLKGYTVDETMNQSLEEMLTPDSLTAARIIIEKVFKELASGNKEKAEETFVAELEQNCKDGSTIWTEIKANFILDSKDHPTGIIGVTRDISDRKRAEDTLRKSEEAYRNLFDSLPDPVAIVQDDLSIKINPAFTRLFGYSLQDIEKGGGALGLIKSEEDKKVARERIGMRINGKKVIPEYHSVELVSKKGQTIPCEVRGVRIQYDGRPASLVSFLDITERKVKEDLIRSLIHKIIKTQERERQLISCELHDSVAQDLSFLKITTDMILKYKSLTPGVRKQIFQVSDILEKTIMTIRDLSYGLRPPGLEKFGLVQTLYNYCKDFSEKTGIRVDFHSAGIENLTISYESMIHLYRVVQEGLNNIRKHSSAKNATIRLVASYPQLIIRIEDDGKGFNLAQSLVRASNEKRMGIQSMQERASLLQGSMRIESVPGKGSKIIIRIPQDTQL